MGGEGGGGPRQEAEGQEGRPGGPGVCPIKPGTAQQMRHYPQEFGWQGASGPSERYAVY